MVGDKPDHFSVELISGRWVIIVWRNRRCIRRIQNVDRLAANELADELQRKGLKRVKAGGRR